MPAGPVWFWAPDPGVLDSHTGPDPPDFWLGGVICPKKLWPHKHHESHVSAVHSAVYYMG